MNYWHAGAPLIDRKNVILRTGANADMRFNQFIIAPCIGDGSPVDQTMRVDDLVVGDARPSKERQGLVQGVVSDSRRDRGGHPIPGPEVRLEAEFVPRDTRDDDVGVLVWNSLKPLSIWPGTVTPARPLTVALAQGFKERRAGKAPVRDFPSRCQWSEEYFRSHELRIGPPIWITTDEF